MQLNLRKLARHDSTDTVRSFAAQFLVKLRCWIVVPVAQLLSARLVIILPIKIVKSTRSDRGREMGDRRYKIILQWAFRIRDANWFPGKREGKKRHRGKKRGRERKLASAFRSRTIRRRTGLERCLDFYFLFLNKISAKIFFRNGIKIF